MMGASDGRGERERGAQAFNTRFHSKNHTTSRIDMFMIERSNGANSGSCRNSVFYSHSYKKYDITVMQCIQRNDAVQQINGRHSDTHDQHLFVMMDGLASSLPSTATSPLIRHAVTVLTVQPSYHGCLYSSFVSFSASDCDFLDELLSLKETIEIMREGVEADGEERLGTAFHTLLSLSLALPFVSH